jgi:hypothetical protein
VLICKSKALLRTFRTVSPSVRSILFFPACTNCTTSNNVPTRSIVGKLWNSMMRSCMIVHASTTITIALVHGCMQSWLAVTTSHFHECRERTAIHRTAVRPEGKKPSAEELAINQCMCIGSTSESASTSTRLSPQKSDLCLAIAIAPRRDPRRP